MNEQQRDIWAEMESHVIQTANSENKGTFESAISIINQRMKEIRKSSPELAMTTEERTDLKNLSQSQPEEYSEIHVDNTQPERKPELVFTEINGDTYSSWIYPEDEKQPALEQPQQPQEENQRRIFSQAEEEPKQTIYNDEPHFSASDFEKEAEESSLAFSQHPTSEQVIMDYQEEKRKIQAMELMTSEFASNIDVERNSLPLHNDGSLRDFFHNTRSAETILIFGSDKQNMTSGEIMDIYYQSDDPQAEHRLNQAMDAGYREMLSTHQKDKDLLQNNPESTQDDWKKLNAQHELEKDMYNFYRGERDYKEHEDYINRLELGHQNKETAIELYNARNSMPSKPSMESMIEKYEEYKEMTPNLESWRNQLSEQLNHDEISMGQSKGITLSDEQDLSVRPIEEIETIEEKINLTEKKKPEIELTHIERTPFEGKQPEQPIEQPAIAQAQAVEVATPTPEVKAEVSEVEQKQTEKLELSQDKLDFKKQVEANLQNPEYLEKANRIQARFQKDLTMSKNKSLAVS